MRFNKLSIGAAVLAGTVLALSAGAAQADDRWDHRWDRERHYDHWRHDRYVHERPVYIRERAPVIVERERPVYVAPPVVYPMVPQGPSGLNLNFNIPLN
jgi:hypothetical protein